MVSKKKRSGSNWEEYANLHNWQCIIKFLVAFGNVLLKDYLKNKKER